MIQGKTVIVIDDGIATGSSMLAAIGALRSQHPQRIVIAVPVATSHAEQEMKKAADEFVCVLRPQSFFAIGEFYEDFSQAGDSEVRELLARAAEALNPKRGVA